MCDQDTCVYFRGPPSAVIANNSNSEFILHIIRIHGNNFFVKLKWTKYFFPCWSIRSSCTNTYYFLKYIVWPFTSCEKIIIFQIFEIIWALLLITPNKSEFVMRIQYAEWISLYTENTWRNQHIYGEYEEGGKEFCCAYLLNAQNEAVCILRICRMNLFVYWESVNKFLHILRICRTNLCIYWEYAEHTKSWISRRILNQNGKYFRTLIRSLDGYVWPNH